MSDKRTELIRAARSVCGPFPLGSGWGHGWSAGGVGAALRTAEGEVYTGICIDLGSGLGFCAEVAAIAEMLKHHRTRIEAVVAVAGRKILPPCGRCRETMMQIDAANRDCMVIVDEDRDVPLAALLPDHWLTEAPAAQGTDRGAP